MKTMHARVGKISDHSHGLGTVTREMVEQRAKELAIINGRAHEFTEEDLIQAKLEMMGDEEGDEPSEDPVAALTRWDEVPDPSGHRVENSPASDEQSVAEHLVQEGVEEANHEQMLRASREDQTKED